MTNTEFRAVEEYKDYLDKKITQDKLISLRYLRKASPEAYAYVIKTDEILSEIEK